MNQHRSLKVAWALLLFVVANLAVWCSGCATTDDQKNTSERPWNSPKGWEGGVPSSLYDRQR